MGFTTQQWLDEVTKAAGSRSGRPGVDARAQFVLTGAPDTDGECSVVVEDGSVTSTALGALDDPDVTMTLPWKDAVEVAEGALGLDVAFMQGRLKAAGDTGKVLEVLFSMRS